MNILKLQNISKSYGHFKANKNINLSILNNEIHAILGENGAGKSTLMKIIFGEESFDAGGNIIYRNEEVVFKSSLDAISKQIGMVHQHFHLIDKIPAWQNIILGFEPRKNSFFKSLEIDRESAIKTIQAFQKKYHLECDLFSRTEKLSLAAKQKVEILKVLHRQAQLIIFDEPTAVLLPHEIAAFFQMVRDLKSEGKTILIITHKLDEIKALADRCSILRKGELISTIQVDKIDEEKLAELMVGESVELFIDKSKYITDMNQAPLLTLKKLCLKSDHSANNITLNFSIYPGEVFGIAGVDGNGQEELIDLFSQANVEFSGEFIFKNTRILKLNPELFYAQGIALVPSDRRTTGLILDYPLYFNFILNQLHLKKWTLGLWLHLGKIKSHARSLMEKYDISPKNISLHADNLSGGNQQKLIMAREIDKEPDLLVLAYPTRGVDVQAIAHIHKEILNLKKKQKAILLISNELDELMQLSDRIGILAHQKCEEIITIPALKNKGDLQELKEMIGLKMVSQHEY